MLTADEWEELHAARAVVARIEGRLAAENDGREVCAAGARSWLDELLTDDADAAPVSTAFCDAVNGASARLRGA